MVLTNEVLPDAPTTNGFSISLPFTAGAVQAIGTASFDFAECSFSLGGTATFVMNGSSAAGQSMESALGQQQNLQIQLGSLFGDGNSLPPSITIARAMYQAESKAASFAQQAATQQSLADQAAAKAQQLANAAMAANENVQNLQGILDQKNLALTNAIDQQAASEVDALSAYWESTAAVTAAQQNLDAAEQAVIDANVEKELAAIEVYHANSRLAVANDALDTAITEAQDATVAADDAAASAADAHQAKLIQISVDWTHCLTCTSVDSLTVSGEANVGIVVAEADVEFQFGETGITSIQATIGGGWEKQLQDGGSDLGLFLQGEFVLDITAGWAFPSSPNPGWFDLSATLQATADLDVYLNTWCCSFNEQLLSVDLQGSIQLLPTPKSYSLSGEAQILMLSFSFTIGPNQF